MVNTMKTVDEILALIKYDIEYADVHGGCPPVIKAVNRYGVAKAKQALSIMLEEIIGPDWQPHCDKYDSINSGDASCTTCWNRLQRNIQMFEQRQRATDRGFTIGETE